MDTRKLIVVGPVEGSNGHQAAIRWRSRSKLPGVQELELTFTSNNRELIPALEQVERGSYAMVPIENGNGGFVPEIITSWVDLEKRTDPEDYSAYRPRIVGATVFPVVHSLLVHSTIKKLSQLEFICSHPQAIEQSKDTIEILKQRGFAGSIRPMNSTAEAAFKSSTDPRWGSIASAFTAERHGLKVFRKTMQDSPINDTRFQVVTKATTYLASAKKTRTAMLLRLNDNVGSLARVFDSISRYGGMVRGFQSFPEGKLGKLGIYLEYEILSNTWATEKILTALRENTKSIFVLGSYSIE